MSWADFEERLRPLVTLALAERVRQLRVDCQMTWREVSDTIFDYPEGDVLQQHAHMRGDQPLGMYLCELSEAALGVQFDEKVVA